MSRLSRSASAGLTGLCRDRGKSVVVESGGGEYKSVVMHPFPPCRLRFLRLRPQFIKRLLFALAIVGLTRGASAAPGADRPNFVVILGEAQGWAGASVQMDDAIPESKS